MTNSLGVTNGILEYTRGGSSSSSFGDGNGGLFDGSEFHSISPDTKYNGASWNSMNNPMIYRFPKINDNDPSVFAMPVFPSISYIDKMVSPKGGPIQFSDTTDTSAFSMFGGNQ